MLSNYHRIFDLLDLFDRMAEVAPANDAELGAHAYAVRLHVVAFEQVLHAVTIHNAVVFVDGHFDQILTVVLKVKYLHDSLFS